VIAGFLRDGGIGPRQLEQRGRHLVRPICGAELCDQGRADRGAAGQDHAIGGDGSQREIGREARVIHARGRGEALGGPGRELRVEPIDHRQRQRRAVNRSFEQANQMRHTADVVLVSVRQDERRHVPPLLEVRQIGNDPIHAEQFRIREHHAGVDDNRRLVPAEREHVHTEFAKAAKGYSFEHVRLGRFSDKNPDPRRHCPGKDGLRSQGAALSAARSGCWARLK